MDSVGNGSHVTTPNLANKHCSFVPPELLVEKLISQCSIPCSEPSETLVWF